MAAAMLNSRDISLLRSDVASNCRIWVERCREQGLNVLVTQTVRDAEYQEYLYAQGRTRPGSIITNGKRPTFHWDKAGLAFDFCKNVRGHEYDDAAFFRKAAAIAKEIGFTWGGDWKSFVDLPHIQWDAHGKYTNSMILAGKMPTTMPLYEKEGEEVVTYKYLKDIPDKFRPIINDLMTAGIIQGDGSDPTGNGDIINLTHEQVRTLIFVYRGGGFDRKLRVAGLTPAVQ